MKANTDLTRRLDFDNDADLYDSGRNTTDVDVVKSLVDSIRRPNVSVLEIGAGTGQATIALARLADSVVALEPGRHMTEVLRTKLAGESLGTKVTTVTSDFERYDADTAFDLICSFNAFQWVKFPDGVQQVYALLAPEGVFAPVWSFSVLNSGPVQDQVNSILATFHLDDFKRDRSAFELESLTRIHQGQQQITGTGLFRLRTQIMNRRTLRTRPVSYLNYIRSLANGSEIGEEPAAAILQGLPSEFEVLELTIASAYERDES